MENPVEITEKAMKEICLILDKKGIPKGYGLRIGVKGGTGCAGIKTHRNVVQNGQHFVATLVDFTQVLDIKDCFHNM